MKATRNDGLDEAGFIRQVPRVPFQAEYRAVLAAVRRQLPALLGAHLVALYVYGSVAEGRARPGRSDLDLTLILSDACPAEFLEALERLRRALERQHPTVSKIDFDIGRRAQALAAAHRYSWGYWLKHQCRWLWGEDLARRFAPFTPELAIVRAVNGEVLPLLRGFVPLIAHSAVTSERLSLQREAARRLLRALPAAPAGRDRLAVESGGPSGACPQAPSRATPGPGLLLPGSPAAPGYRDRLRSAAGCRPRVARTATGPVGRLKPQVAGRSIAPSPQPYPAGGRGGHPAQGLA